MEWKDNMDLTPDRLNNLQTRACEQPVVVFDIEKGFYGQDVIEAINDGKLVLINSNFLFWIERDSSNQRYETSIGGTTYIAQFGSKVWNYATLE